MRRRDHIEAFVWIAGLIAVGVADPTAGGLLSVCPFHWVGAAIGLEFCPGCGLGHAVGFLARGELMASLAAHPFGIPAVLVLSHHITRLIKPPNRASR
ncbi:MAG: hypothetical protein ACI80V_000447 [Rhodothermales bacterium]|jgi:hypothetical protein